MKIWMTPGEEAAFRDFLGRARNYLEFGCGGSTVAAAQMVSGRVAAVDSSREWLDKVSASLAALTPSASVALHHADIGPIRQAGYPADESRRDDWPLYHSGVWEREVASLFDLVLIDGRFRVPCFLQAALRCRSDTIMMFHDYAERRNYHVVARVAREVFRRETLSVFVRPTDFDRDLAQRLHEVHRASAG